MRSPPEWRSVQWVVMSRKPCGWSWRRAVAVGYTPEVSQFDMIKKHILYYFIIYRDFMMIDLSVFNCFTRWFTICLSDLYDFYPYFIIFTYHIYQVTINWTPPYLPVFTRFILIIFTRYLCGFLPSIEGPWSSLFSGHAAFREDSKAHVSREVRWRVFGGL